MHIAYFNIKMLIHLACKVKIALLLIEKVTILDQYLNFIDVFLKKGMAELFKRSNINKHLINLELDKQLPYILIYSLKPVKLETLKTYIKTNLINGFIQLSKSPAGTFILFGWKSYSNFCICIIHCGFNNLNIKNPYLLLLIDKLLNQLDQTKQFT